MNKLAILRYPDPRLKIACSPVAAFDDNLHRLAADLLQSMRAAPGIGITAAHVGILTRLVVIELGPEEGVKIYINPMITWMSSNTGRHLEGSVCMPGATEEVTRSTSVRFRYEDLHGVSHEEEASGLLAVCVQHEIDQLDGIFWLQRLSKLKRDRLLKKWEKSESVGNV